VQDFVPKGHASRFIMELVRESLDLKEITGSYVSGLGQPPFDPRMMVALLLHSYASGGLIDIPGAKIFAHARIQTRSELNSDYSDRLLAWPVAYMSIPTASISNPQRIIRRSTNVARRPTLQGFRFPRAARSGSCCIVLRFLSSRQSSSSALPPKSKPPPGDAGRQGFGGWMA
jgi:hypothetical protein